MPGSSGVFSLRQIFVLLIVVALTVLLVRQVTWRALLVGTGGILFAAAGGIYVFFPSRKGYERPGRAFRPGRGTGLWGWLWAYGSRGLYGNGHRPRIVGSARLGRGHGHRRPP